MECLKMKVRKNVSLKVIVPLVVITGLTGCASPNLKSFVDQTVKINSQISTEMTSLEQKVNVAAKLSHAKLNVDTGLCITASQPNDFNNLSNGEKVLAGQLCVVNKIYKPNKQVTLVDYFKSNSDALNGIFNELVKYANSLSSLSTSGDESEESLNSLNDSINKIASLAGYSGAVDIATDITKFAAKNYTIYQSNKGLRASMGEASEAIEEISEHVNKIIIPQLITSAHSIQIIMETEVKKNTIQNSTPLHNKARNIENDIFGQIVKQLKTNPAQPLCVSKGGANKCFDKATLDNYLSFKKFMKEHVEPAFEKRQIALKSNQDWFDEREKNLKQIQKLLKLWNAEHKQVRTYLETCKSGDIGKCTSFKSLEISQLFKNNATSKGAG